MTKKTLFIIGIILIGLCSIVVTIVILLQTGQPSTGVNPPVSSPTNVVTPVTQDLTNYNYALINKDDNIKLKDSLNSELLINIDTKNWKNIQWSVGGSYVSALGETTKDIFNLYIYNISTQKWIQATLFDTAPDGVTSYQWVDNDTILFTSGGWVHRYKYSTKNEIVKIYQADAQIIDASPNDTTILLKDSSGVFSILTVEGKLLFTLDKITIKDTLNTIAIKEVYYNKDSESLLLVADGPVYYLWKFGDPDAKTITLSNDSQANLSGLKILCSQDIDLFKTYRIENGELVLTDFDLNAQKLVPLAIKDLNSETPSNFMCSQESRVEFSISNANQNNWYELQDDKLSRLVILDEATDVAIKNITNP